jgi:hypothetical protein
MVERELGAGPSFMNSRGLLHFDAHFENILTDGRRLYFTDYGLAISSQFELSQDEAGFFGRHQAYDRRYTATYLVNWLVTALYGYQKQDREGRHALVRAYAERIHADQHSTWIAILRRSPAASRARRWPDHVHSTQTRPTARTSELLVWAGGVRSAAPRECSPRHRLTHSVIGVSTGAATLGNCRTRRRRPAVRPVRSGRPGG